MTAMPRRDSSNADGAFWLGRLASGRLHNAAALFSFGKNLPVFGKVFHS
jgi:hypothetical protein